MRLRADELASFAERLLRVYKEQRNGHRSFGEWVNSLDVKTVNELGTERGARDSSASVRSLSQARRSVPMTIEMKSERSLHAKLAAAAR